MKRLILFGLILLIPIVKVDALNCSYSDLAYLKKLATNISYSYDYIENNNNVTFSITLTNLQDKFYIVDKATGVKYYYNGSEITLNNYQSGQVVRFDVYSSNITCAGEILYTMAITLPTYNPYYTDPLCKDISSYSLCQKWSSNGLSYDKFKENVQSYLNSLKEEETKDNEENTAESYWSPVLKFLAEFYYIPLALIIVGNLIWIAIINKKSDIYN